MRPGPGAGFAILVNANAKRGGRRIAVQLARTLTGAKVKLTKTPGEIDDFLRSIERPRCILAAGGDGTAIALVNAMDRVYPAGGEMPPMGALPLGTGNAWAHTTGSRKLRWCVEQIADAGAGALPLRRFGLVNAGGTLAHFAGSGWDSQVLEDYKSQLQQAKGPTKRFAKSVYGYLTATLFRTVPKQLIFGQPHVILENLGGDVFTISADGKLVKMCGVKHGEVLYDGPASVSGAATCSEFGYRFRAYPFAERMLGFINVRVYDEGPIRALPTIPKLWRGQHPLKGMHDWFVTAVRMTYSRPVALQLGGDALGMRQTIEYRAAERQVDVLEWRRLG